MARAAHAFVLAALLLAAGAHGQSLTNSFVDKDPSTIKSGLNLVQSVAGVGAFTGRALTSTAATDASSLLFTRTDPDGWKDTFTTTNMRGDILNGIDNALSIASRVTDTIMQPYLWLADTNGQTVYKVDTNASTVVGAYASRPSGAAGNPVAFAVLQNGDAFVGNAFTFGASESGSLTKIQADSTTCGAGSTSTGLGNVLSWASTTPSLGDATDKCIKGWASLGDNTTSIAAIGADGADNVYTLAVNEQTRFAGFLNIYVTPPAGTAPQALVTGYVDSNRITNTFPNATVNTATSDGPGAPGGSGLVIDKWGYLWSGGGTYIKNFGGAVGRKNIVIRMNTQNPGNIMFFPVAHETQALAFDNNGNLWVSGAGGASLMKIDPDTIGFTVGADASGTTVLIGLNGATAGAAPINLLTNQGACAGDTCCEAGNYNTGIAVARTTGEVYIANECPTGKVMHLDATGNFIGVVNVGAYPSAVQVDARDTIWVPVLENAAANTTGGAGGQSTKLVTIAPITAALADSIALTSLPFLGGIGDQTGRYTAQPPATGTWTWVHDTTYDQYNKWTNLDTSSFPTSSFAGLNYTTRNAGLSIDPSLTILADTSNTGSGSWAGSTLINDASTSLTLPNGRYIRFVGTFTRSSKQLPEIGPQAFGVTPLLQTVQLRPRNNWPNAICVPKTVNADIPAVQTDTTYGTANGGRVCGANLDITTAVNNGSYDSDTAELDSIVPIQPTEAFYSPNNYTLVSAAQRYTLNTLTVTDAHGGVNQCSERVNIIDTQPPAWKSEFNLRNTTAPNSGDLSDISTLCIWPPNFKYYCWLDVTSNDNDQVIPLYDNCGGSVPIGKQVDGFVCEDSDPRTVAGDCVLYKDGPKYNLCVMAQRRTVYTNTARVYQVNFPVTDASTIDSGTPTIYKRQVKIPPLWNFQTSGECPRPTYKSPSGVSIFYTNAARK